MVVAVECFRSPQVAGPPHFLDRPHFFQNLHHNKFQVFVVTSSCSRTAVARSVWRTCCLSLFSLPLPPQRAPWYAKC
eukprot:4974696-Pleurochrysis_carterae.AAC.2